LYEVLQVKIARTFTIDYHLYQELRKKPNQSRIVEQSIKNYLHAEKDFNIHDLETLRLMHILVNRDDCPKEIKAILRLFTHPTD
jgi:hypothetical protein